MKDRAKASEAVAALLGEGDLLESWRRFERDRRRIRQEADAQEADLYHGFVEEVTAERDRLAADGAFEQAADLQLVLRRIRRLAVRALPDPYNLTDFREREGEVLYFRTTGGLEGTVWGTDVYADDSRLSAAAVHAGVLADGATGVVKVTFLVHEGKYEGSERNGVASKDYGAWTWAYRVEAP